MTIPGPTTTHPIGDNYVLHRNPNYGANGSGKPWVKVTCRRCPAWASWCGDVRENIRVAIEQHSNEIHTGPTTGILF